MKKTMIIEEYKSFLGVDAIIINNIRYQKCFPNSIERLFKLFLIKDELFFGFYRTDGINLTSYQQQKLEYEIPVMFKKYGDIENLSEYLSVARINSSDHNYCFIPSVFDYYLETTIFKPKIGWKTFKEYHSNYQKHRFDDIILNNFADVLFFYFDSGDFLICFDSEIYDHRRVRNAIDEILLG